MSDDRPYPYVAFPKVVYRIIEERGQLVEESLVVQDARALELAGSEWTVGGPVAARAAYDKRQEDLGQAAAHRAYEDRNMSPAAQAEVAEVEDSTRQHVAEVKRKPGRPKKGTP